jgi:5-methylcytosine-specific restriction endonuclease McrA
MKKAAYQAYLAGPLWKSIRSRVLARDKNRCRSCGRRAWQVHHGSYDAATMAGRDISRLVSVCGECHHAISFTILGERRPWAEVKAATAPLCRTPKKPKAGQKQKPPSKATRKKRANKKRGIIPGFESRFRRIA